MRGYYGEPEAPGAWYTQSNFSKCKHFIKEFEKKWDFPEDFSADYALEGMHCI